MMLALLLAAAAPSAEALALGERLARTGTLASLLPLMTAKETDEMIADQADLSEAERLRLRAIAAETAKSGIDRIMAAEGKAYAEALSVADLRALVAHSQSDAARRHREAMPRIIMGTMASVGEVDFKGETLGRFCRETGKGCRR